MDRMLFIAASGAKETLLSQAANANNLANANTDGFKSDRHQFRAMLVEGPGWNSRAYALSERPETDKSQGALNVTGRDLDVTAEEGSYFQVLPPSGQPGLVSTMSMQVMPDGTLVDASGHPVLNTGGAPIVLPPFEKMRVGNDGNISIIPAGAQANETQVVDQIALYKPDGKKLEKGLDGFLRLNDGTAPQVGEGLKLMNGVLESSNVNTAAALVDMISYQRKFDLQIKMMQTAKQLETSSDKLLSIR